MRNIIFKFVLLSIITISVSYSQQTSAIETSVKYIDLNNATLVGENGLSMRTTNGGITWTEQNTGTSNFLYGNDNFDTLVELAVGENGIILKTTNGGNNWIVINSGVTTDLYDVEIADEYTAYACGADGILLGSYDNGDSWQQVYTQPGVNLNDIVFIDAFTGFAAGDQSSVLVTWDGGISWTNVRASFDTYIINAIGVSSSMNLTVVGEGGLIYNSSDGGYRWTLNPFQPDMNIKDILFFTSNDGIMVGNNSLIYRTTDGGYNWTNVTPSTSNAILNTLYSISFSSSANGMIVGNNGVEMYTTNGGLTWVDSLQANMDSKSIAKTENSVKNYPNPFNPSTRIRFNMPAAGEAEVNIFDITGRRVASLFKGNLTAGSHEFLFDAAKLSSGIYISRISVNVKGVSNITTGRMLLVK